MSNCRMGGTKTTTRLRLSLSRARNSLIIRARMRFSMRLLFQAFAQLEPADPEEERRHQEQRQGVWQDDGPDIARQEHRLQNGYKVRCRQQVSDSLHNQRHAADVGDEARSEEHTSE